MYIENHLVSLHRGISHIAPFLDVSWMNGHQEAINLLERKEGSRAGCLRSVVLVSEVRAMNSYFAEGSFAGMKKWAYVAAKLRIMLNHLQTGEDYLVYELLWPLISDNEDVIDWYRQHNRPYMLSKKESGGDKDDPKSFMFYRYQSWLALNARWDELRQRCELILGMQDEIKKDRSYLIDHRFYLALANGDKAGMEAVLLEKCQPKQRKARHDQESGLTHNFIVSYATLFAKLAWRNGYKVEVDTPWIPKDWLPVKPLETYEDPWPFMQSFDIYQPFEGDLAAWSPKRGVTRE
jgi:hypothetical protein